MPRIYPTLCSTPDVRGYPFPRQVDESDGFSTAAAAIWLLGTKNSGNLPAAWGCRTANSADVAWDSTAASIPALEQRLMVAVAVVHLAFDPG